MKRKCSSETEAQWPNGMNGQETEVITRTKPPSMSMRGSSTSASTHSSTSSDQRFHHHHNRNRPLGTTSSGTTSAPAAMFIKYRCFIVPIGLFLLVHLILAVCLTLLYGTEELEPRVINNRFNRTNTGPVEPLDLSALSFIPSCNITTREAISAIQRAKTPECKEQLAKTACKIVDSTLYEKRLPRYCSNDVTTYGRHLGCFQDDKKNRLLPDTFTVLKNTNSPRNCIDLCLQWGFQYAGVQYGIECFCGNTEPSRTMQTSSSECTMKCPDSPTMYNEIESTYEFDIEHDYCGGYFTMDVFETGVYNAEKSKTIGFDDYDPDLPPSKDRTSTGIVFFLTLNGRASRQVFRLIKSLFHERHYFYIHVDSRQDFMYREMLGLRNKLPNNVRLMSTRRGTIWGGSSLLTVLLDGMEELVLSAEEWNWKWDYVINLSESDFPLKTTSKLQHFLTVNMGKNFLKSHGRDVQKFIQKQGLDRTFDECEYRMWRVGDRKLPSGILVDGGSDWIALHHDYVSYIVNAKDDILVDGLKTVFKHTLLPAESFFHTLLRNSHLCETFVDNNLHVTNWRRKLGCKCQYKNIVDWCGCSPNDFRMSDWSRLQLTDTRLLFFGRKFEPIVNQAVVNQLESWLYPKIYEKNLPTLDRFWMSIYHHHDSSPRADDALVTLGRSLSRIASKSFLSKCLPSFSVEEGGNLLSVDLIDIMIYNHEDKIEGILVKFQSRMELEGSVEFSGEAWFKQNVKVEKGGVNVRTKEYQEKLQNLQVGAEYEQKEQIFRNYAGVLGPLSEPTLAYSAQTDESYNVSVVWVDSRNAIRAVSNATISNGTTANFVKPSLKGSLPPGRWTVKVFTTNHYLLYRVHFPILPLEVYQGRIITQESEESIINAVNSAEEKDIHLPFQDEIDELVTDFYSLQDYCLEKHVKYPSNLSNMKLEIDNGNSPKESFTTTEKLDISLCSHTQWSSFYPDPKSTITGVDPETGFLLP